MRLPHVKIWWLMVVVAIIAVACWAIPPWWRWHIAMLKRSAIYARRATITDQVAAKSRTRAAKHTAQAKKGAVESAIPVERAIADVLNRQAAEFSERARIYSRAATLPWLGPKLPE